MNTNSRWATGMLPSSPPPRWTNSSQAAVLSRACQRAAILTLSVVVLCVMLAVIPAQADLLRLHPVTDSADGVEVAGSWWYPQGAPDYAGDLTCGYDATGNRMEPAFLFRLEDIARGDSVAFARLRFSSLGGEPGDALRLEIRALLRSSLVPFGPQDRPSSYPTTSTVVEWTVSQPWEYGGYWDPLYVDGPDIAAPLNELFASEVWPAGGQAAGLALSIRVLGSAGPGASGPAAPAPEQARFLRFSDTGTDWKPTELIIAPRLEDAFLAAPLLGRPTDEGVTVSFAHHNHLDCYVAYGTAPGLYEWAQGETRTRLPSVDPILGVPGGAAREIRLGGLEPDRRHYLRLFYRAAGSNSYSGGEEITFHTARGRGSSYVFDILSDSHLEDILDYEDADDLELYRLALSNVVADSADFVMSLGDFAICLRGSAGVRSLEEARRIYSDEREILGERGVAGPFYHVLGNHEGEVGWIDDGTPDGLFTRIGRARKEFMPNPEPDAFYSGNVIPDDRIGAIQNYYAWEWGDALYVVLDPFRATLVKPDNYGGGGSGDPWDWTLGREQYEWLESVLASSSSRWKFVFTHHLVGGVTILFWGAYGRGGIEAASHDVAGLPSYECGGEDETGRDVFQERRPGWAFGSIHDMLRRHGVTAVFHGHDHCFCYQQLDGIVYQECPRASTTQDHVGFCVQGRYVNGTMLPSSGHVRVSVGAERVRVEYVRAFLPGQGDNGSIAYAYEMDQPSGVVTPDPRYPGLPGPRQPGSPDPSAPGPTTPGGGAGEEGAGLTGDGNRLQVYPQPCRGELFIRVPLERTASDSRALPAPDLLALHDLRLHDISGRAIRGLAPPRPSGTAGVLRWDLAYTDGTSLPDGVYFVVWRHGGDRRMARVLITR